ncbi:hypothetical protein D9Q98_003215 [Chlorella vulgaris]|uniref:Aminotransferase class I/classII large domain-containing protein n=1 Tax=Chlorella vulgaris TaxID=3077 RepID=A0A9D4YYQ9_CHLVU|nr:hypothetical protein D9Q98_003215 [Chlorella vulgaris]
MSCETHELEPFKLERFFAKWEFVAPHQLCCSDSEPLTVAELLSFADADAQQRWDGLRLAYTETQGLPELREAIAAAHFTSVAADQLVIGAPQELLYLCMQALLRPSDHVVCCYPGYQSLYSVAHSIGCEVEMWHVDRTADGTPVFDLHTAEQLIRPTTRLVVVNSPHNPTGAHFTGEQWLQLCRLCRANDAYLFSDEMYRHLELEAADRLPAAADMLEQTGISLSGMSKAVGCPGLRIGWLAIKDRPLLERVLELKDFTTICSSAPSEILALIGLRSWDAILERQLAIIRANLEALDAFFARWRQIFDWQRPCVGTVAFPRLLTGESVAVWCEELVQQAGVLLMPATVYDHPQSTAEARFRLGFGRRNLPTCLQHLDAWLAARYGPIRVAQPAVENTQQWRAAKQVAKC